MGANLEKSLFAPRAYAVPLYPKGEIVFVCTLRLLWSCYASPAFAVFVCFATSKSLYTSRRPYKVSIWFAHPCSPYTIKSARVSAYLLPPLQSPNTLRTYAVSIHLANLKSLHHITQPYAVSIVPERLCSLRMNKSRKVFAYSFALAVSIVTKYLCSLHTSRQSQKSHHISRAYESPFAPRTSAVLM